MHKFKLFNPILITSEECANKTENEPNFKSNQNGHKAKYKNCSPNVRPTIQ